MANPKVAMKAELEAKYRHKYEEKLKEKEKEFAQLLEEVEAKATMKTEAHVEIDTMAMLLMVNERLQVGPGRADGVINDFLAWKLEIAEAIVKELDEDQSRKKELIIVKRDLAQRLKEIMGQETWEKRKTLFPFLREFWEW